MKNILLVGAIVIMSLLCSCQQKEYSIADYFVFKENAAYIYKGEGDERASQEIYMDFVYEDEKLYQRRIVAADQTVGECYSLKNGELEIFYSTPNFYFYSDMTKAKGEGGMLALKEPLKLGAKWQRGKSEARISEDIEDRPVVVDVMAEVTGVDVEVSVPYGTFKTIEITETMGLSKEYKKEYYAKGIGLIKTVKNAVQEEYEGYGDKLVGIKYVLITSVLEKIEENKPYISEETFYYVNSATKEIEPEKRNVEHRTNEEAKVILERELKNYNNADMKSLWGSDINVNAVVLKHDDGKVFVDFSKELIIKMNSLSPDDEGLTLQALANTLCYFFYVPQVNITVDGKPYSSNNITQKQGEFMKIDKISLDIEQ